MYSFISPKKDFALLEPKGLFPFPPGNHEVQRTKNPPDESEGAFKRGLEIRGETKRFSLAIIFMKY